MLTPTNEEHAEVLIVGAGPGGGTVARYLAERGIKVVALEQGSWQDADLYPAKKPEIELLETKKWNANPNVRANSADYPIDDADSEVTPVMFNGVGGGTILYGGAWHRALPSDFRVKTFDGVADDWPFSYEELAPYYDATFKWFGVSGAPGDPMYPDRYDYPTPALPLGEVGRLGAQGMQKLGWHWWPASLAIPSRPTEWLSGCRGWGTCQSGCPELSKGSADLAVWKPAVHHGAKLITQARVREITVTSDGKARGAVYLDSDGVEHEVTADVVVLAANGIGTPRIMLLSKSNQFPDGIANSSGLVGKNLMLHPYTSVSGVFDEFTEAWTGPWGNRLYSLEHYETNLDRGFVRGAKWSLNPTGGPLSVLTHGDDDGDKAGERWGDRHHEFVRERVGHTMSWDIIAEDLPQEANRVELADDLVDSSGIPAPKVVYRESENTKSLIEFNTEQAHQALLAAGAHTTEAARIRASGWHILGTARMGDDPANSVVDGYGRCHDVENLYVVDGSVFVTSFGVNPTATIAAVALRAAEHIAQHGPRRAAK